MGFFSESKLKSYKREPVGLVPSCRACGLFKECESPKIGIGGGGGGRILLVLPPHKGAADADGDLFAGRTGQYLRRMIRRAIADDIANVAYHVPVLACYRARKPEPEDIYHCRPLVNKAIEDIVPRVIVPIGYEATASVVSIYHRREGNAERFVGYQIPCRATNTWIVPLTDPTRFLNAKDKELQEAHFIECAKPIRHLFGRPYTPTEWEKVKDVNGTVTKVLDPKRAAELLRAGLARTKRAVAFDYEANMIKPENPLARLYSCAVCFDGKRTLAYPLVGEAIEATKEMLQSPIPKIAANLKYEDRWSRKVLGVEVVNWYFDTMLAAHGLDNRSGVTGLKFQAFATLGLGAYDDHIHPYLAAENPDGTNNIHEIDMEDLLLYNGLDAWLEYELAVRQMRAMGYPLPKVAS